jgi:glutamate racemase
MTATHPRILVFDSGVGGLSIVREIRTLLPHLGIDYVADNAFFPYGTRHESELAARVPAVMAAAIARLTPALVVVGCNSASTIALDLLRQRFAPPFVGVVPAIKPAAAASVTKTIGLLATEGTVMREYTRQLARQFAHDCTLVAYGSSELVVQAERLLRGQPVQKQRVQHELAQLWAMPHADAIDAVVLGCTHFPLLKPLLMELAPAKVNWVDSGAAIARRVASLLPGAAAASAPAPGANTAFFTAPHDTSLEVGFAGFGFRHFGLLAV